MRGAAAIIPAVPLQAIQLGLNSAQMASPVHNNLGSMVGLGLSRFPVFHGSLADFYLGVHPP